MTWEIDETTGNICMVHEYGDYHKSKLYVVYNPQFDPITSEDQEEINRLQELHKVRKYLKEDI